MFGSNREQCGKAPEVLWGEVLVLPHKGLVLGLLLTVVVGQVGKRWFCGKGLELGVLHAAAKDLILGGLREFGEHGEREEKLLQLGNVPVEVREVIPVSTISDVGEDHMLKHMCHLPQIMVESRDTSLLVLVNHLVDPGLVLGGLQTLLQVVVAGSLALQVRGHLLHQRVISRSEAREQVRFFRTQLGEATVPIGSVVTGCTIM